mmetsp:Transcript_102322/g.289328  ORF Transcript_102322/g.289328 Transcript_102322/m.289328 type:complete len:236 (-) Transcript_102322:214-921(-)
MFHWACRDTPPFAQSLQRLRKAELQRQSQRPPAAPELPHEAQRTAPAPPDARTQATKTRTTSSSDQLLLSTAASARLVGCCLSATPVCNLATSAETPWAYRSHRNRRQHSRQALNIRAQNSLPWALGRHSITALWCAALRLPALACAHRPQSRASSSSSWLRTSASAEARLTSAGPWLECRCRNRWDLSPVAVVSSGPSAGRGPRLKVNSPSSQQLEGAPVRGQARACTQAANAV